MKTKQKSRQLNSKKTLLYTILLLALISPTFQASFKESISYFLFTQIPTFLKFVIPLTLLVLANYLVLYRLKVIPENYKMLYTVTITILLGFLMVISELKSFKHSGCYGKKVTSQDFKDMFLDSNNEGFTSFGGFANDNPGQTWRCFTAPHPKYGISGLIGKGYSSQSKLLQGKTSFFGKIKNLFSFKKNYGDQAAVDYKGIHSDSRWSLGSLISRSEERGGVHGADGFFFNFKDWEMCKDSEGLLVNVHRILMSGIAKIVLEMPDGLLRDEGIREVVENMGIREKVQVLDMRGGEVLHRVLGGKKITKNLNKDNSLFVSDVPFLGALIHHEVIQYNFKQGKNVLWLLADEDTLEKFQFKKLNILSYRLLNDPILFQNEKSSSVLLKPFKFIYNVIATPLSWLNPFRYFSSASKEKSSTAYNPHPVYETEYEKYKNREIKKIKNKKKWYQFWKKSGDNKEEETPLHQSNYRNSQKITEFSNKALTIIISTNSNKVLDTLSKHPTFSDSFKFISCYERRIPKITKFYQEKIVEMKQKSLSKVVVDRLDVEKEVDHMIEILGVDLNSLKSLIWSKEDFIQGNKIDKNIMEKLKLTKISFLTQRQASFVLAYLEPFIGRLEKLRTNNIEVFRMLVLVAERMAPGDVEKRNIWLEMNDVWEVLDIGLDMSDKEFELEEEQKVVGKFNLKVLEMGFEYDWLVRNNEKVRFKDDVVFWVLSSGVME